MQDRRRRVCVERADAGRRASSGRRSGSAKTARGCISRRRGSSGTEANTARPPGAVSYQELDGTCNVYVSHEGQPPRFIATISSRDNPDYGGFGGGVARQTARVSPDGRWLAFMSERSLTGYDNVDAASGQADEEVFLYDAVTGGLSCVSCDPTGARPHGMEYANDPARQLRSVVADVLGCVGRGVCAGVGCVRRKQRGVSAAVLV